MASLAELRFGVQVASDAGERARRLRRLATVEAEFDPVAVDVEVARAWGALAALSTEWSLRPRRRATDLLIAATAQVLAGPLISLDEDLLALGDVIEVRARA